MALALPTNLMPQIKLRPALCLDLDGTVRRSKSGADFIKGPSDVELMPGIEPAIWNYRRKNFWIVGVSNQGGVAHGYQLPNEVDFLIDTTVKLFNSNPFHTIKCCYNMEDGKIEPFRHRSLLRKPDIGMLAIAEWEAFDKAHVMIDWNNSLMVGDRTEDEGLAANAHIKYMDINDFLKPHSITINIS